jgi:hypothetical protein
MSRLNRVLNIALRSSTLILPSNIQKFFFDVFAQSQSDDEFC